MKNLLLILAFLISGIDAWAAAPARGRGGSGVGTTQQQASSGNTAAGKTTGARAARQSGVKNSGASTNAGKSVGARSATPQAGNNKVVGARAATTQATNKTTAARAGTKQNVISSGTKVATATQNTVVDEECWNKFSGCMDSFCMLDNATGGRCICSDKNAEYDSILAEIQDLDNQSYQMATVGVERIEMGDDADAVMAKTKAITNSIEKDANKEKSKRKSLDLAAWNNTDNSLDFDEEVEDIFSLASDGVSVANKKGDALYRASAKLCVAQIPECSSQNKMMELMYQQRIRSDCTAYENSLRQQRTQSAQKLASAQAAMREAALEQYRNANKYDLGQCTIEFKKCMQTTGGCGEDFTGCVTQQTTRETLQGGKMKMKKIKGASTTIEIAAWTYDALESKKPLCMTVTQQCVNVKNQVWDTFLREVAPQVKSAELAAESDLRMSCISTISDCFQKACKENMDPNNPDGSYDMCLTRPDTLRSFCKVQIDPCEAAEPKIMDYVRARLASMRVDSCTKEFKECLQSEDRCGADYSQCVGLDTDTIVRLCPAEKLVGCQYEDSANKDKVVKSEDEIYDELARIAQGIFLDVDNNMLTTCQKAVDAAMMKVCGSTEDCDDMVVDNGLGSRSLEYKICNYTGEEGSTNIKYDQCKPSIDQITDAELGRNKLNDKNTGYAAGSGSRANLAAVIDGVIYWDSVKIDENGVINVEDYFKTIGDVTPDQKTRISGELSSLETSISNAIKAIESDPKVQYCKTGRNFQGMRDDDGNIKQLGSRRNENGTIKNGEARFPKLTDQVKSIITTSALAKTRENYYARYDELNQEMEKDYAKIGERIAEINNQNEKDIRRDIARESCLRLAQTASFARSPTPPQGAWGKWAMLTASTFLFGVGGAVTAIALIASNDTANASRDMGEENGYKEPSQLTASHQNTSFNYRETITTTFEWENLICHKCIRTQPCKKIRTRNGEKYCKEWGEEKEERCNDTQF